MSAFLLCIAITTTTFSVQAEVKSDISSNPLIWMIIKQLDRLENTQKELVKMVSNNEKLATGILSKYEEIKRQLHENKNLKSDVDLIKKNNGNLEKTVAEIRNKGKGPAFTAVFSKSGSKTLHPGEIIVFDKVYFNRNGGYNPSTGLFSVPKTGVYSVSCTVRPFASNLHVYLWKNNTRLALAFGGGWHTGSLQVVLHFKKGDQLYIKHADVSNEKIQLADTSMFSAVYILE